ncbi:hypothetical protein LWC05_10245 [Acetobacter sicerae]|uniref:Bacteriocin n=1 Tax=Acetobacter sicerae TaxID=85325 RepID=A0ABS8W090_9PROT|nr:hypothetical protein [Acetobacter sicerae]MCE0744261.1 hypothetical protein [Acetobacter sicerae]
MRELTVSELNEISGGAGLDSLVGNALIGAANTFNSFLDAIGPIGVALTYAGGPVVGALHEFNDYVVYEGSKAIDTIGQALGGTLTPDYHYVNEWQGNGALSKYF